MKGGEGGEEGGKRRKGEGYLLAVIDENGESALRVVLADGEALGDLALLVLLEVDEGVGSVGEALEAHDGNLGSSKKEKKKGGRKKGKKRKKEKRQETRENIKERMCVLRKGGGAGKKGYGNSLVGVDIVEGKGIAIHNGHCRLVPVLVDDVGVDGAWEQVFHDDGRVEVELHLHLFLATQFCYSGK
jgi:hypothetical protein